MLGTSGRTTRWLRIVGAAVLVGGLLVGPFAAAGQAADLKSFAGSGSGYALQVTVDLSGLPAPARTEIQGLYATFRGSLPAQAQAALPDDFPFVIDQRFIETLSQVGEVVKAQSLLGSAFSEAANATHSGDNSVVNAASHKLPTADLPVLNVSAGDLTAAVSNGPKASSRGTLATVSATLNAIQAVLPPELQTAFADAQTQINSAITTANTSLDTALGNVSTAYSAVGATTDPILGPVLGNVALQPVVTNPAQLAGAIQFPTVGSLFGSSIARISSLDNSATTQKMSDGRVVSTATSKLSGIDLLGLVHVGAMNLSSQSVAAGLKGSAKNTSTCSLADVKVGTDGVSLDGKTLYVNGTAVPVPVADVSAVKTQVTNVLNAAGVSVTECNASDATAAGDGTSATQSLSALRIQFAPKAPAAIPALGIAQGAALMKIIIDPSVDTSAQAVVGTPLSSTLPHTGAGTAATVVTGLGIASAALILRRRLAKA